MRVNKYYLFGCYQTKGRKVMDMARTRKWKQGSPQILESKIMEYIKKHETSNEK